MADFILVHRNFSEKKEINSSAYLTCLTWSTCLRQILFLDSLHCEPCDFESTDQILSGVDAEAFLLEVLCGLKSPLIGETEVFGQFKLWWKYLPETHHWKQAHRSRIESLFSVVKCVREKILCGQGSQSYGSLLRRHLEKSVVVDLLGAGNLVQEMIPWIQKQSPFRVWCRDPKKLQETSLARRAQSLLAFSEKVPLSSVVVVAAPIQHLSLRHWLLERGFSSETQLFDFRSDSADFQIFTKAKLHLKLSDFTSQYQEHREDIEKKASLALEQIQIWKNLQESRIQIRPYGWDDL